MIQVFDHLELEDLTSIGQTCQKMNQMVELYFQSTYAYHEFGVDELGAARNVNLIKICGSIKQHYDMYGPVRPLKGVCLAFIKILKDDSTYVRDNFFMMDTIKIKVGEVRCDFYKHFLQFVPNLRHLLIRDCEIYNFDWMAQKYVALERLSMFNLSICAAGNVYGRKQFARKMTRFLELNPGVKELGLDSRDLLKCCDVFHASNIQLDRLIIQNKGNGNCQHSITEWLLKLHELGFYKALHLILPSTSIFSSFNTFIDLKNPTASGHLERLNITELSAGFLPTDTAVYLAKCLVNLERLNVREIKAMDLLPFLRHTKNLKVVTTNRCSIFYGKVNLLTLDEERQRLDGACKVRIYVDEFSYLDMKWTAKYLNLRKMVIKRIESCENDIFTNWN